MSIRRPRFVLLVVLAVAAVTTAACTGGASPPRASSSTTGTAWPGFGAAVPIGQRYTWSSGVAIEVAPPTPATLPAAVLDPRRDWDRAIVVSTTIVNGSDQPYLANPYLMGSTPTHGGRAAIHVFGVGADFGRPPAVVLPGRSYTYQEAFWIGRDKADLQLEYQAELAGDKAIFVGRV